MQDTYSNRVIYECYFLTVFLKKNNKKNNLLKREADFSSHLVPFKKIIKAEIVIDS